MYILHENALPLPHLSAIITILGLKIKMIKLYKRLSSWLTLHIVLHQRLVDIATIDIEKLLICTPIL